MNDLIRQLGELCEVDKSAQALREQLALYPKMLSDLDAREQIFLEKRKAGKDELAKAKDAWRKAELEVRSLGEQIQKYLQHQSQVKTNKEFTALTQEIDGVKAKIDAMESLGLEALETETKAEEELKNTEKELQALANEINEERSRIKSQITEKEDHLKQEEDEHRRRAEELPEELRDMYELLNERFPGSAIVPVKNNCCGGCSMNLVSQVLLDVRRGEVSARCENCARLLYAAEGAEVSKPG